MGRSHFNHAVIHHCAVQLTEFRSNVRHHAIAACLVRGVETGMHRIAPRLLNFCHHLFELGFGPAGNRHLGTRRRKAFGHGPAETIPAAGNQNVASAEVESLQPFVVCRRHFRLRFQNVNDTGFR